MFEFMIEQIEKNTGKLMKKKNCLCNGMPEYIKDGFFNYVYSPISPIKRKRLQKYFRSKEIELPEELWEFYGKCNGVRIALSAFSIYGFPSKGIFNPFDLTVENLNIHIEMDNNNCDMPNIIFFGSLFGEYLFAYDMKQKQILCIKRGTSEIIYRFNTLKEIFEKFLPKIFDQYDENCNKKKINKDYSDIPILANSIASLDEIK